MKFENHEVIDRPSVSIDVGTSSNYPTTRAGLNLVLLFPGIRNYDVWTSVLRRELSNIPNVKAETVGLSEISTIQFLMEVFLDTHDKHLHMIDERISKLVTRYNPAAILFIGHSYGTLIIARFLETYRNYTVSGIVLAGSVLPVDFMWCRRDGRTGLIVNECGENDYIPVLAGVLSRRFGASGRVGFSDHTVINRWHPNRSHWRFFYFSNATDAAVNEVQDSINQYLKPILLDGLVKDRMSPLSLSKKEKLSRFLAMFLLFPPKIISRLVRAVILVLSGRHFRSRFQ